VSCSNELIERPGIHPRRWLCASIFAAGLWAWFYLGLTFSGLAPSESSYKVAKNFLLAAFQPAIYPEGNSENVSLLIPLNAVQAAGHTILFAAAGISLGLALGVILAVLSSTSWWPNIGRRGGSFIALRTLYVVARTVATGFRSIHELLWAVLFLSAFGVTKVSAVMAIALPYAGIFSKVFSELLDEAPRNSADALRLSGAGVAQSFLFGIVPRALPDIVAYTFYRFECAIRTSAVLGFFGFPTLGYYISASFENLYYREVWTYLYVLAALVMLMDSWSGQIRRRFR